MLEFSIWSDGKTCTYARGSYSVGKACCAPDDPFNNHKGAKIAVLRSVLHPIAAVPPELLRGPEKVILLVEEDVLMASVCSLNLEIGYNLATYNYYSLSKQLEIAANRMSVEFHVTAPASIFIYTEPQWARGTKLNNHTIVAKMGILEKMETYPHLIPDEAQQKISMAKKKPSTSNKISAIKEVRKISHDIGLKQAKEFVERRTASL